MGAPMSGTTDAELRASSNFHKENHHALSTRLASRRSADRTGDPVPHFPLTLDPRSGSEEGPGAAPRLYVAAHFSTSACGRFLSCFLPHTAARNMRPCPASAVFRRGSMPEFARVPPWVKAARTPERGLWPRRRRLVVLRTSWLFRARMHPENIPGRGLDRLLKAVDASAGIRTIFR